MNVPFDVQFSLEQPWMFSGGEVSSSTMIDPDGTTEVSTLQVGGSGSG